ncbi:hypothetical protein VPH35_037515 [Triticum aestivum]
MTVHEVQGVCGCRSPRAFRKQGRERPPLRHGRVNLMSHVLSAAVVRSGVAAIHLGDVPVPSLGTILREEDLREACFMKMKERRVLTRPWLPTFFSPGPMTVCRRCLQAAPSPRGMRLGSRRPGVRRMAHHA